MRCDEIEQKDEVHMRTWIENKVTEAMIRVCYKCGKRFYKTEGCNMMHCVCGASMWYVFCLNLNLKCFLIKISKGRFDFLRFW